MRVWACEGVLWAGREGSGAVQCGGGDGGAMQCEPRGRWRGSGSEHPRMVVAGRHGLKAGAGKRCRSSYWSGLNGPSWRGLSARRTRVRLMWQGSKDRAGGGVCTGGLGFGGRGGGANGRI